MEFIDRRPLVVGISGSTRSISGKPRKGTIIDIINRSENETALRSAFCDDDQPSTVDRHVKQPGIRDGDGFNLYKSERQETKRNKTFSNTEVALATALYGAKEAGADVDHLQLNRFFTPTPGAEKLQELKGTLLRVDGIVLATPVYFGDRSFLVSKLIDIIRSDAELKEALTSKVVGGIAVAAKRNGGQETSLIYQLLHAAQRYGQGAEECVTRMLSGCNESVGIPSGASSRLKQDGCGVAVKMIWPALHWPDCQDARLLTGHLGLWAIQREGCV